MDDSVIINVNDEPKDEEDSQKIEGDTAFGAENDDSNSEANDDEGNCNENEDTTITPFASTPLGGTNKRKNKGKKNNNNTNQSKNSSQSYCYSTKGNKKSDKSGFCILNNSGSSKNQEGGKKNKNNNNNSGNSGGGDGGDSNKQGGNNKNGNNSGGGHQSKDFLKHIWEFGSKFRKTSNHSLDSWVLFLYYRWGFFFFYLLFMIVFGSWFAKDPIVCVSSFNVEAKPDAYYLNICLSYPYVEDPSTKQRHYVLFYRWIHYSCLVIGYLFYLPRSFIKVFDDPRLHSLLDLLNNDSSSFDENCFAKKRKLVALYLNEHLGAHTFQAFFYIFNHLFAACIGYAIAAFIDFNLQGQFLYLPLETYPFDRDPQTFTDDLSKTFPPFAKCTIERGTGMMSERKDTYSCHLTLMEMYEKVFFVVWFFVFTVILLAILYSLFMLVLLFTPMRRLLLRTSYSGPGTDDIRRHLARELNVGDFFLLYKIKPQLPDRLYYFILKELSEARKVRKHGSPFDDIALKGL